MTWHLNVFPSKCPSRHTMTGHPKSIKNAGDVLLRHPLSQLSDMRLVFSCEIMVLEYQLLESLPTTDADDPRCQAHLQEARTRMDQWFSDWDVLVGKTFYSNTGLKLRLA